MKTLCKPSMPCLWSRLLLLLLFILPMLLSGQNTDAIKRLNSFGSHSSYDGIGPDSSTYYTFDFNYDFINRFLVTSYRNHGNHSYGIYPPEYWDDTFGFVGYSEFNEDSFIYSTPTLHTGLIRYCVMDYNGYVLEEHYSSHTVPSYYMVSISYQYNPEMKLIGKMRSQYNLSNLNLYWKTDYTLDALGRRTEEITYKSADSLSWQPKTKIQYTYSEEVWNPPCQFEKYNTYLPDLCFHEGVGPVDSYDINALNYQPFYMNDTWKISHYTYSTYVNQEWLVNNDCDLTISISNSSILCQTSMGYESFGHLWTLEGIPTLISGGEEDVSWGYYFYFNSPSANNDDVNQVTPAVSISSYPNPNNGESSLRIKAEKQQPVSVITYNLRGQKLKEEVLPASANGKLELAWKAIDKQGNPLPKGIYLIKAVSGKQSAVVRVTSLK